MKSSGGITIRPGVKDFFDEVSGLKGFRGFVLFTAKEDKAAWSVYREWKRRQPELFSHVLGFYTRNYLRFDHSLPKPSKDLRLFDPELKHVVLIDDNESRVLQPEFNYRIPKFNADLWWAGQPEDHRYLLTEVLAYVADQLDLIVGTRHEGGSISEVFSSVLGSHDSGEEHILFYRDWVYKDDMDFTFQMSMEEIVAQKLFEPEFIWDFERVLE